MNHAAPTENAAPRALRGVAQSQERLGALPIHVTMREAWLGHAGIHEGQSVLDVGCGTGVVTRALAQAVGRNGRVVAVDASEALLRAASRLARAEGVGERIEFRLRDASDLQMPPHSVDHVVASLVFQHLSNAREVLIELRRVLRPGGGLVLFEQDIEALAVDHPDRGLTRIFLQYAMEHYVLNSGSARRLPGQCTELGFDDVEVLTFLQAERSNGGGIFTLLERIANQAAAQGRVRLEQANDWIATLEHKADEGTFFASLPHYAILARKPSFAG